MKKININGIQAKIKIIQDESGWYGHGGSFAPLELGQYETEVGTILIQKIYNCGFDFIGIGEIKE
jgi:hypothetical protein